MKSSSSRAPADERLLTVATSLRLRGAGGRLTATLLPGGIDQFRGRDWLLVGRAPGPASRLPIETYAIYGRRVVLKFRGVDRAADAAPLVGLDILMPCNGLVDLPQGAYYIFELVGMRVVTGAGRELGQVRRVLETGGAPLLLVGAEGEGGVMSEILIPAARAICTCIDRARGLITVEPPEGLLELYGV